MTSSRKTTHAAARTRSFLPVPVQSLNWSKKVTPWWEQVLADKNHAASELSTVSTAITSIVDQVGTMPDSSAKMLITDKLMEINDIIDAQSSEKRTEVKRLQMAVNAFKADSVAPKTEEKQKRIVLQFLQVLNNADPEMKVSELFKHFQSDISSVRDQPPEVDAQPAKSLFEGPRKPKAEHARQATEAAPKAKPVTTIAKSNTSIDGKGSVTTVDSTLAKKRGIPIKAPVADKGSNNKPSHPQTTRKGVTATSDARALKDTTNQKSSHRVPATTKPTAPKPQPSSIPKFKASKIRMVTVPLQPAEKRLPVTKVHKQSGAGQQTRRPSTEFWTEEALDALFEDESLGVEDTNGSVSVQSQKGTPDLLSGESKQEDISAGILEPNKDEPNTSNSVIEDKKKHTHRGVGNAGQKGVAVVDKDKRPSEAKESPNGSINDNDETNNVQEAGPVVEIDGQQVQALEEQGLDASNIVFGHRRQGSGSAPSIDRSRNSTVSTAGAKRKRFVGDDGQALSKKVALDRHFAISRGCRCTSTAGANYAPPVADMMDIDSMPVLTAHPAALSPAFRRPRLALPTHFDPDEEL